MALLNFKSVAVSSPPQITPTIGIIELILHIKRSQPFVGNSITVLKSW
jgi:hypothetical protein